MSHEPTISMPLGAGDTITRFPDGGPYRLRVETGFERKWRPRLEGTQTRPTHPGTALIFQGRYWEVVAMEVASGGDYHYFLAPWDDRFVIRRLEELSEESSEEAARMHREANERRRRASFLLLATPFLGLLPARVQSRLESDYGTSAGFNTGLSAVLIGMPASVYTILGMAQAFGGGFGVAAGGGSERVFWPALYFLLESLLRLGNAMSTGHPMGSLPVVLVAEVIRAISGRAARN